MIAPTTRPLRRATSAAERGRATAAVTVAGVAITNPHRIVFADARVTKLDLVRYYAAVAPWLLPHIRARPLSLVRCPDGVPPVTASARSFAERGRARGSCFYQRHPRGVPLPESVRWIAAGFDEDDDDDAADTGEEPTEYLAIDGLKGLVSLVQMGTVELHPWGCRADDLSRPDRLVFDLDPDPALPWGRVVEAALVVRARLRADAGLESFVKTSGGKGLHVVVPLRRHAPLTWQRLGDFAARLAHGLVNESPRRYTATMSKARRAGKVFLDHFRNRRTATCVAPFAARALSDAPLSWPLSWSALTTRHANDAPRITLRSLPDIIAATIPRGRPGQSRLGHAKFNGDGRDRDLHLEPDPWPGFFTLRQTLR